MSRTIITKRDIYTYDELSEEAKEYAYEDYCECCEPADRDTLNVLLNNFESLFPISITSMDIYDYDFEFEGKYGGEIYNLKGIRLLKYIYNNYYDKLFRGKIYYYNKKHRQSKIIMTVIEGLFGGEYDDAVLKPIYDFLKKPEKDIDFYELLRKCLDKWNEIFNDIETDFYNEDNFRERARDRKWEFYEDGEIYCEEE
jgi:hypothetical protein